MYPVKEIKINKLKEEWLTNELLEHIKFKDTLLDKANISNNQEDWERARRTRNQIKQVIPENKSPNTKIILKDSISGQTIYKNNTADYINNCFVSVGPTGTPLLINLSIEKTTPNMVRELVKDIACSKSSAIDHISSKVLKDALAL